MGIPLRWPESNIQWSVAAFLPRLSRHQNTVLLGRWCHTCVFVFCFFFEDLQVHFRFRSKHFRKSSLTAMDNVCLSRSKEWVAWDFVKRGSWQFQWPLMSVTFLVILFCYYCCLFIVCLQSGNILFALTSATSQVLPSPGGRLQYCHQLSMSLRNDFW